MSLKVYSVGIYEGSMNRFDLSELMAMDIRKRRKFFKMLGSRDVYRLNGMNKREFVYRRYGGKCALCGEPLVFEDMTFDHIFPRVLGGSLCLDNCQPAHSCCNGIKGDMYPFLMSFDEVKSNVKYDLSVKRSSYKRELPIVVESRSQVIEQYRKLGFIID